MINKEQILQAIRIDDEAAELLGPKKNGKYRCFRKEAHANNDLNPSLTMNKEGYWACHSCSLKGDFFQLYMDAKGIPNERFGEVINHFARKYGVDMNTSITIEKKSKKAIRNRSRIGKREAHKQTFSPAKDIFNPRYNKGVLEWLSDHYGITGETVKKFYLGWNSNFKRLFIPIPVKELFSDSELSDLINIRKHDIMRYHVNWFMIKDGEFVNDESGSPIMSETRPADVRKHEGEWHYGNWKPEWGKRGGKVFGVRGHNNVYLYPMSTLNTEGDIWIVGGELKALLLIQNGISAVTFTSGEGNYAGDLLELFNGRSVRIVYDIDKAGQKGALNVGQALVQAGASVKVGQIPAEGLPSNGDITDYMRLHKWDIECLNSIAWKEVKVDHSEKQRVLEEAKEVNYVKSKFSTMTDGVYLGKYIEVPAIVSGRGTTPFAVPYEVSASCTAGLRHQLPRCKSCSLVKTGFKTPGHPKGLKLGGENVVDMTGMSKDAITKKVKELIGIPAKCGLPSIKTKHSTVERVILCPTVDVGDEHEEYRHQQVYLITDGKVMPKENEEHILSGKLIGDPRNNAFTLAVLKHRAIEGNVFTYKFQNTEHSKLKEILWTDCSTAQEVLKRLVSDMRDNILHKYGVDTLITVELLSWFMPFQFKIGNYLCHKVCPEVLILGDTRVGKSTTAKDLAVHFGAGRYVDCGANATFVGLVGGNTELGSHRVFTWGVLPTSHRGHVTMDEANKLRLEVWGGLTNLKSSGRAERTTNTGARKTRSAVRLLTLCNPRGSRALGAYDSPLDAAIEVVGTPQDLARIDLLYVAWALKDISILNTFHETNTVHSYTREVARYHLKWAWALDKKKIKFASPEHVLIRAQELLNDLKGIRLVAASEAKFKIGRIAIAIASLVYSYDHETDGVIILNEHVDMAYALLRHLYTEYMKGAGIKTGVIPESIIELFNDVDDPKRLRILSTSDSWTQQDFIDIFGSKSAIDFKVQAQLEHNLMTRRRNYFIPNEGFQDIIRDYVNVKLKERA